MKITFSSSQMPAKSFNFQQAFTILPRLPEQIKSTVKEPVQKLQAKKVTKVY